MEIDDKGILKFDPKDFIKAPYFKCPKCGEVDSFGVLMVCDYQYVRRCRECMATATFSLPKLDKKIVYLDQFVVSNMMKSINPQNKSYNRVDQQWRELFVKLDRLCKLQVIICPESFSHEDESLLSPYHKELRSMIELLSYGIGFKNYDDIRQYQIMDNMTNWLKGSEGKELPLDPREVMYKDYNIWQDRFIISVMFPKNPGWIEEVRSTRDKMHEGMKEIFERWQKEKKEFNEWVAEEYAGYSKMVIKVFIDYINKTKDIYGGGTKATMYDWLPPPSAMLIMNIKDFMREKGVPDEQIWLKIIEYFQSENIKDVPFNRLSSMLFASIARKAASGRTAPPTKGIFNDIDAISVLLPYCHAMFVDRECAGYLRERPLSEVVCEYKTEIFSVSNIDEFITYLNKLEKSVSEEITAKVKEVFGDDWGVPFVEMYDIRGKHE